MATITPGTGATIISATAEGQLHEIMNLLRIQEKDVTKNPSAFQNIAGDYSTVGDSYNGSFDVPVTYQDTGAGTRQIIGNEYLTGVTFSSGTGGTFKSSTPVSYFIEVIMYLQDLEANTTKNPNGRNFVTGTYSSDNKRFTGSVTLPVKQLITDGHVCFEALEYLTT